MGYKIERDEVKRLVRVNVFGPLGQDVRIQVLMEVFNVLTQFGYSSVLVDVREVKIDPDEPVSNAHELVDFMKRIGFKPDVKMAFVYSESVIHRKYFETVSNMQGLNIKYAESHDQAYEWLDV